MNLELKHLAAYLPYKLKINNRAGIFTMVYTDEYFENLKDENPNPVALSVVLENNYNLILKPISDLSLLVIKEFEKYDGKRDGKANEEVINLFCEENGVNEFIENIDLKSLPYECIEFMFKNHYDFFDLITQGLAISIHDVG